MGDAFCLKGHCAVYFHCAMPFLAQTVTHVLFTRTIGSQMSAGFYLNDTCSTMKFTLPKCTLSKVSHSSVMCVTCLVLHLDPGNDLSPYFPIFTGD